MLGAIVGDIVGSPYEFSRNRVSPGKFVLFPAEANYTDDTLLTLAVGHALMEVSGDEDKGPQAVITAMRDFAKAYRLPKGGYGGMFRQWLQEADPKPYGSFGNGSAMRVSAVGWLFPTLAQVERWAEITAAVTHNHPEGIKGAQATAGAIFLARTGKTKQEIKAYLESRFGYDLSKSWKTLQARGGKGVSCQETVPEAVLAFLGAQSFKDCLWRAVSLGGDTDTRAAIAGSIAEGYFIIPHRFDKEVRKRLAPGLVKVLDRFNDKVSR
jgi:ADP-ribosylglycohydrolase